MKLEASLQAYRGLLQEQSDLVDAMLENFGKLAEMSAGFEHVAASISHLRSVPSVVQEPHAVPSIQKQPRVRGVLAAVRRIVDKLPGPFDKNDVMAKLIENDSDLAANVSPANLRNTLRILAKNGDIRVQIDATSTTCAKYVSTRVAA